MTLFISIFSSVWNVILLILVAGLVGAIAEAVAHHHRGGCLASIGIGFIGAVLGYWLAGILHLPNLFTINVGGVAFPIVYALLGGLFLLLILRIFRI